MVNNMHRAVMLEHLPDLPDNVKLNDQNDAFLYAMALAGEANDLVTGDRRAGLLAQGNAGRARKRCQLGQIDLTKISRWPHQTGSGSLISIISPSTKAGSIWQA